MLPICLESSDELGAQRLHDANDYRTALRSVATDSCGSCKSLGGTSVRKVVFKNCDFSGGLSDVGNFSS